MGDSPQTIYRIVKNQDHPYVMLDKRPINRTDLSWKAKGIWAYLMSKPDDWEVIIDDIIKHSTDGERAVRSGIQELRDKGFMWKAQERDESGKIIRHLWLIFEEPQKDPPDMGVSISAKRRSGGQEAITLLSTSGLSTNGKRRTTNKEYTNKDLTDKLVNHGQVYKKFESLTGRVLNQDIVRNIDIEIEKWDEHEAKLMQGHPSKGVSGIEAFLKACDIANEQNVTKLSYIQGIFKNWYANGYLAMAKQSKNGKKPVQSGEDYQREYEEKKRKGKELWKQLNKIGE